jgi:hypothetical protein
MSTVQINPFRPSPSYSATNSYSELALRFLLRAQNNFLHRGPTPLSVAPAMETQQSFPFALLCYVSPPTMLLWCFYVDRNNKTYSGLHVQCPIFLSGLNHIWICSTGFHKCFLILNFFKRHQVGAWMIHTDRRTDMTKRISTLRCCVRKRPK